MYMYENTLANNNGRTDLSLSLSLPLPLPLPLPSLSLSFSLSPSLSFSLPLFATAIAFLIVKRSIIVYILPSLPPFALLLLLCAGLFLYN